MRAFGAQSVRMRSKTLENVHRIYSTNRAKYKFRDKNESFLKFRWDMSVTEAVYSSPPPNGKARTLAALTANCHFSQPNRHLGSKNPPILPLALALFWMNSTSFSGLAMSYCEI